MAARLIPSAHIDVRLDDEGRIIGYQGIMRDITERKIAQKALQEARDELQTRVDERTAELLRQMLDSKVRSLSGLELKKL